MFIGTTDVEAETPILWPPDVKSWLIWKDSDAGKDWGQEEKGTTEHEMVSWHHQLNEHGLGWTPGVGDGQGVLACCGSWGSKESDMTEWLNWSELNWVNAVHQSSLAFCIWTDYIILFDLNECTYVFLINVHSQTTITKFKKMRKLPQYSHNK